jgi:putative ABC transport system permease protein
MGTYSRNEASKPSMADLGHDLRYSIRSLRVTPAFTLVAVLVLAIGIGVTTAVFSVVDAVLLRPLPYPDPARLVWLGMSWPSLHEELLPGADYAEWRQQNRTLQGIAAFGLSGTQEFDFRAGKSRSVLPAHASLAIFFRSSE